MPILVALYGDLRLVLLTTVLATALSDIPMFWRFRKSYREASILIGFLICGLIGIVIGTRILLYVRVSILAGVLAAVVIAFILVSWFGKVPTMSRVLASRLGPLIGFVCGIIQGSAGASGPIVTTYLVSSQLSRDGFLFAINAIFFVLDWTQFVSLQQLHLTTHAIWTSALAVAVLAFAGMGVRFRDPEAHRRHDFPPGRPRDARLRGRRPRRSRLARLASQGANDGARFYLFSTVRGHSTG